MKSRLHVLTVVLCVLTLALAGCASYYKVQDPQGDKFYYTTDVEKMRKTGAVTFKDAVTGAEITLQSSEVHKIDKKEFKEATKPAPDSE